MSYQPGHCFSLSLLKQERINIGTFSLSLSLCYRSHQVITSFLISSPQTPMALSLHLSLGRVDKNIGRGVREKWAEILTLPLTSSGYFREVTQPFQVSVSSFGKWEQYPSHGVIRRLKEKSVCKAHGSVVVPSTPSKPRSTISFFTGLPSECVPITRL